MYNKLLDSNELNNLIQHLLFGDPSRGTKKILKPSMQPSIMSLRLRALMSDSFKILLCFDKMLRLTHPYSLLYRDLLLFILYFIIFHSQVPLLIIWYLMVVYFLVYMYVFF